MLAFANNPYSQSQAEVDGNGSVLVTNQSFGQTDLMMALDEESLQLILMGVQNIMVICPVVAEIFQSVVEQLADRHRTHQFDIKSKQKKVTMSLQCKWQNSILIIYFHIRSLSIQVSHQTSHVEIMKPKSSAAFYIPVMWRRARCDF